MPIVRALGAIVVLVLPSGDSVSKPPDVDEGLDVAELDELAVLLELEELCVVAGVGDTDEPELEATGLDVCVPSPGVLDGDNVTPGGRKYTSSRNTAPIRSCSMFMAMATNSQIDHANPSQGRTIMHKL